ncbi:transcriptional regulator KdgR [Peptococcaceae bacterium CEB3]|nr:transcriptional regulator KdgR [Peptococcaceae bacterium CEB3]
MDFDMSTNSRYDEKVENGELVLAKKKENERAGSKPEPEKSKGYKAPVIYKTFAILQEVARSPDALGLMDLIRRLGYNKSTVYGITQALLELEALQQDPSTRKLSLGPLCLSLGKHSLANVSLTETARPFMKKLSLTFAETVFLGIFDDQGITITETADSQSEIKISAPIGTRIPIFAGAAGKVFLAYLSQAKLTELISRDLPQFTPKSITRKEDYLSELKRVRKYGYATDYGEYLEGVNAICVPLPGTGERIQAALWIVGFGTSFGSEKMKRAAKEATACAQEISFLLRSP